MGFNSVFKGLNAELNPICHLLALLGADRIFHVSELRVKESHCVYRIWISNMAVAGTSGRAA